MFGVCGWLDWVVGWVGCWVVFDVLCFFFFLFHCACFVLFFFICFSSSVMKYKLQVLSY